MSDGKVMTQEEWNELVRSFAHALIGKGFRAVTVTAVRTDEERGGNDCRSFMSINRFRDDEGNPGVKYWNLWAALVETHRKQVEKYTQELVSEWEQRILAEEAAAKGGDR